MTMTYEASFQALEHSFRVRSNIAGMGAVITRLFAGFSPRRENNPPVTYDLLERADAETPYELLMDGTSIQRVGNPGSMIDWLIADVAQQALMESRTVVAVHAGTVAVGDRATLLPAPPEHGKSTTVAGLVQAGFSFLSDEAALVHPLDGRVYPFPRPLMLSPGSIRALPGLQRRLQGRQQFRHFRHHVVPDDLRPGSAGTAAHVAFIVAPRYARGAQTLLEPMARPDALRLMLEQCFNLPVLRRVAVEALGRIVRDATCYRLSIGDLGEAVALIQSLYEEPAEEAG